MKPQRAIAEAIADLRTAGAFARDNPDFNMVYEAHPITDSDEIDEWEQVMRDEAPSLGEYAIPANVREVYAATGALRFQWVYRNEKELTGALSIVGVVSLYQSDEEAAQGQTVADCFNKQIRPFDILGRDLFVGMRLPRTGNVGNLIYVDNKRGTAVELGLDPVQYMVELSRYRGIFGWQKLFFLNGAKADAERRSLLARVEQVFG